MKRMRRGKGVGTGKRECRTNSRKPRKKKHDRKKMLKCLDST